MIRSLDREQLIHKIDDSEAKLEVLVKCTIPETSQKFKKRVTIVVHDINDNLPIPIKEYHLEFNKTFIKKVHGTYYFFLIAQIFLFLIKGRRI